MYLLDRIAKDLYQPWMIFHIFTKDINRKLIILWNWYWFFSKKLLFSYCYIWIVLGWAFAHITHSFCFPFLFCYFLYKDHIFLGWTSILGDRAYFGRINWCHPLLFDIGVWGCLVFFLIYSLQWSHCITHNFDSVFICATWNISFVLIFIGIEILSLHTFSTFLSLYTLVKQVSGTTYLYFLKWFETSIGIVSGIT